MVCQVRQDLVEILALREIKETLENLEKMEGKRNSDEQQSVCEVEVDMRMTKKAKVVKRELPPVHIGQLGSVVHSEASTVGREKVEDWCDKVINQNHPIHPKLYMAVT